MISTSLPKSFFPAEKKSHKTCKITHDVRVVLLGLKLLELGVLELLDCKHFARPADFRIVHNVAKVFHNHLENVVFSDVLLVGSKIGVVPVRLSKGRMFFVLLDCRPHKLVKNFLLARKVAVKRRLSDSHRLRNPAWKSPRIPAPKTNPAPPPESPALCYLFPPS